MSRMNYIVILLIAIAAIAATPPKKKPGPTEQIKAKIDKIIVVMNGQTTEEQKGKDVCRIIDELFDWEAAADKSLSPDNRKRFSKKQKKEFIENYTKLIKLTYYTKIGKYWESDATFIYTEEKILTKKKNYDYALVKSEISGKTKTLKLAYLAKKSKKQEQWFVYDISVDGVSLCLNFRAQFDAQLKEKTTREFLDMLKKAVMNFKG